MTTGLLILAIFLVAAILMFFRVLPAMLALPLMAVAIAGIEVVGGTLAFSDLMRAVLADGATRLADAMVIAMLGGMLSSLMQKAGVDFAILGEEEKCTGDPARRMGNEYLAQSLITENVSTLNSYSFSRIVVTCPHCMQALGKEYRQFGGAYEVVHHTTMLRELIGSGKLRVPARFFVRRRRVGGRRFRLGLRGTQRLEELRERELDVALTVEERRVGA